MSNNILVTGISGFVGSHFANRLKKENTVVGIVRDYIPSKWSDEAFEGITLIHGDVRNFGLLKRVINHYNINQIYHIAAAAQVKEAHKNPINFYESNVMGTVNVLEACRQIAKSKDIKILIFNTDKVYGEKLNAIETDRYQPSEPYATSKCCQGFIAKSYRYTYGMNIVISSCCNIYGYDPFNSRLISNTVKACLRDEHPIIFTNDTSIREYIYIDDVVNAVTRIMNRECKHDTYNIHTGYIYNQKEIIMKICDMLNTSPVYKEGSLPVQIQKQTMASVNWDWKPGITFEEGLKHTIALFKKYNTDWVRG